MQGGRALVVSVRNAPDSMEADESALEDSRW